MTESVSARQEVAPIEINNSALLEWMSRQDVAPILNKVVFVPMSALMALCSEHETGY